jgi:hypothetical protein
MNTPRLLNEIGLCTTAFAWSDLIPETKPPLLEESARVVDPSWRGHAVTDAAVLDQRGEKRVVTAITRRERRDLGHPPAIRLVRLVELLDKSKGQSATRAFVILS